MKLISPKTLLSSLLVVAFIVIKVITFDGINDLFWIGFFVYLTIKGLHVAFSQEAYDEDMKQAYQGKALARDLFGKFAYIAGDIPVITIVLSALLAIFGPVTAIFRICLL